jgi:hypothetical protein
LACFFKNENHDDDLRSVSSSVSARAQLAAPPTSCPAEFIKFGSCAMESDKYITVCESGQIAIVDMTAGNAVTRQKISARPPS